MSPKKASAWVWLSFTLCALVLGNALAVAAPKPAHKNTYVIKFLDSIRTGGLLHSYDDDRIVVGFMLSIGSSQRVQARVVQSAAQIGANTIFEGVYYQAYRVAPGSLGPSYTQIRRRIGHQVMIDLGRTREGQLMVTSISDRV